MHECRPIQHAGDDLLGKTDIHTGLKMLLSEPAAAAAPPVDNAVAVNVAEDEADVLSIAQVDQVSITMSVVLHLRFASGLKHALTSVT